MPQFHQFSFEDGGGPWRRRQVGGRDQARAAQLQDAARGIFHGGGNLGFEVQLAKHDCELASGGAVVRRAEEPAVDQAADALVHESEREQERSGKQNYGEDVDRRRRWHLTGYVKENARLREKCEDGGPQSGQEDAHAVAHKEVGEAEAREQEEGAQDYQ